MHNEFSELCFRGIPKNPLRSLMGLACHAGPLQQMSNMSWNLSTEQHEHTLSHYKNASRDQWPFPSKFHGASSTLATCEENLAPGSCWCGRGSW